MRLQQLLVAKGAEAIRSKKKKGHTKEDSIGCSGKNKNMNIKLSGTVCG